MRDLDLSELKFVSGANNSPSRPSGYGCSPAAPKGNNGYGNGSDAPALAPGNSFGSNPTLVGQNTGNKAPGNNTTAR
jgi:hypothetical protein